MIDPKITMDQEFILAKALNEHGARVFTGMTDIDIRRERFRAAIMENNLANKKIGKRRVQTFAHTLTFAQVFQLIYSQPLVPQLL